MLIEQSIAKQYGVLPSAQPYLHYADWAKLVSGLMDDTPLGRVVAVRSEENKDMLEQFTPEQKSLRAEWFAFCGKTAKENTTPEEQEQQMVQLEKMFANLFG